MQKQESISLKVHSEIWLEWLDKTKIHPTEESWKPGQGLNYSKYSDVEKISQG